MLNSFQHLNKIPIRQRADGMTNVNLLAEEKYGVLAYARDPSPAKRDQDDK